jgi:hypothetical protein
MVFISCGSLARLSENQTGTPMRMGRNSITTRCAMCAEGRNAMVESLGVSGSTCGPMSMLAVRAACVPGPFWVRRWRRK